MGGTISKHVEAGDSVFAPSMTDGIGSRTDRDQRSDPTLAQRQASAEKSSEILGLEWLVGSQFEDNMMDASPLLNVVKNIEDVKSRMNPDLVYTHSHADLNVDYPIVNEAVLTAFRLVPAEDCKEIRCFEVASETDFGRRASTGIFYPDLFVDISKEWAEKKQALEAYGQEMRVAPHTRSINSLHAFAKYSGAQVGIQMAECFETVRRKII